MVTKESKKFAKSILDFSRECEAHGNKRFSVEHLKETKEKLYQFNVLQQVAKHPSGALVYVVLNPSNKFEFYGVKTFKRYV